MKLNPAFRHRAIVIELGVNGLGVIRSLAQQGIEVIGVYTVDAPGAHSCLCRPLRYPPIRTQENDFLAQFLDLCREQELPPVLFPTSDEAVAFVHRHRDQLAACALFTIPDRELFIHALNKDGNRDLALSCGIPIPETSTPKDTEELIVFADRTRYPVLFKPNDTFSVKLPDNAKNITFPDRNSLLDFFSNNPGYVDKGVFQEIIFGGDGFIFICAAYFDEATEPLALYTGRKVRQHLPDYGVTCYGESVYRQDIVDLTCKFMKKINFKGLVAVEYVQDRVTGNLYFLEMNLRSYYHNSLFLSCGINLPFVNYLHVTGQLELLRQLPARQREGVCWIDFQRDLGSFWRKYKKGELGPGTWLADVMRARSFGVYKWGDTGPFRYNVRQLCHIMLERLSRR